MYAKSFEKVFPPAVHLGAFTAHSRPPQILGQSLCPKQPMGKAQSERRGKTCSKALVHVVCDFLTPCTQNLVSL